MIDICFYQTKSCIYFYSIQNKDKLGVKNSIFWVISRVYSSHKANHFGTKEKLTLE